MKVAFVYRTQALGVEGVHIRGIADSLVKMGHEVRFFGPAMNSEVAKASGSRGGLLRRMVGGLMARMPEFVFELAEIAYSVPATLKLLLAHRRYRFEAIYERYAIFGFAGVLAARILRVPIILEINYTALSPLVRERSRLLKPLAVAFDRFIFKRATAMAAVSSRLRQQLIEDFHVPAERVVVVPNAADPDAFTPQPKSDPSQPFTIGFVGSFFPWHGVDLLVEAVGRLAAEGSRLRVLLVGDGPQRPEIERQVKALGLEGQVAFLGRVKHDRLPDVIRDFDVGVMPDSNDYGSPMKIFEYMALGKPTIAPDYGPLLDAFRNGVHGFHFSRGNVVALTAALKQAIDDRDLIARMGLAAREHVVSDRNWMNNTIISLRAAGLHS